jgi:hypothetical protein
MSLRSPRDAFDPIATTRSTPEGFIAIWYRSRWRRSIGYRRSIVARAGEASGADGPDALANRERRARYQGPGNHRTGADPNRYARSGDEPTRRIMPGPPSRQTDLGFAPSHRFTSSHQGHSGITRNFPLGS